MFQIKHRLLRLLDTSLSFFCTFPIIFATILILASKGQVASKIYEAVLTEQKLSLGQEWRGLNRDATVLDDINTDVAWFVQVSDVHLSTFSPEREENFRDFVGSVQRVIKPQAVFVTGDITDAKSTLSSAFSLFSSTSSDRLGQKKSEWKQYQSILKEYNISSSDYWLDLRGNHDGFHVYYQEDDLFLDYSASGSAIKAKRAKDPKPPTYNHYHHYAKDFTFKFGTYRVVVVDAVPNQSPARHFFGTFTPDSIDFLRSQLDDKTSPHINQTIVLGHYPLCTTTSATGSDGRDIYEVLDDSDALCYLCGHLHTLFKVGDPLTSRRPSGLMEYELGDFKHLQRYRILALDNDLLSFSDIPMEEWPAVVVTNPQDARFMSERQPLHRTRTSSHIRLLAFGPSPIELIEVYVDGHLTSSADGSSSRVGHYNSQPSTTTGSHPPLYAVPWNPLGFSSGLHSLVVKVRDTAGRTTYTKREFSIDGTVQPISLVPQVVLSFSWTAWIGTIMFIFLTCVTIFMVLCCVRVLGKRGRFNSSSRTNLDDLDVWFAECESLLLAEDALVCGGTTIEEIRMNQMKKDDEPFPSLPPSAAGDMDVDVDVDMDVKEEDHEEVVRDERPPNALTRLLSIRFSFFRYLSLQKNSLQYGFTRLMSRTSTRWFCLVYSLWLLFGPWFISPDMFVPEGGMMCSWALITSSLTVYGNGDFPMLSVFLVAFMYWPMMHSMALNECAQHASHTRPRSPSSSSSVSSSLSPSDSSPRCNHVSLFRGTGLIRLLIIFLLTSFCMVFLTIGYGVSALLLSPCILWSTIAFIAVYLVPAFRRQRSTPATEAGYELAPIR